MHNKFTIQKNVLTCMFFSVIIYLISYNIILRYTYLSLPNQFLTLESEPRVLFSITVY